MTDVNKPLKQLATAIVTRLKLVQAQQEIAGELLKNEGVQSALGSVILPDEMSVQDALNDNVCGLADIVNKIIQDEEKKEKARMAEAKPDKQTKAKPKLVKST